MKLLIEDLPLDNKERQNILDIFKSDKDALFLSQKLLEKISKK